MTDAFVTEEKQLVQATEEVLAGIQPSAEYHICCNGCGEILIRRVSAPSEGLSYLSNGDGTYTVAGIGTCEDEEVVIPSMHNGGRVTAIAEKAFYGCVSLTIIEIPAGVTAIGEDAFSDCFGLEDIFVDRNNENYSSVDGVLFDKAQTELISYPGSKTATQYTVPASVTKIRSRAFNACYDLTDIFVDENNAYYSSVGGVLFNKAQTELVCYPAGKSETRYTVPDGVKRIGDWAFDNCSALTEIELPSGMTSIGACAFLGCYGLKNITVPFGVEEIGDQAFFSCDVMECVTLPLSVKRIGYRAFDMCARLTEIRYGGTVAEWRSITFGAYWDAATPDYTVICTDGTAFKI